LQRLRGYFWTILFPLFVRFVNVCCRLYGRSQHAVPLVNCSEIQEKSPIFWFSRFWPAQKRPKDGWPRDISFAVAQVARCDHF